MVGMTKKKQKKDSKDQDDFAARIAKRYGG